MGGLKQQVSAIFLLRGLPHWAKHCSKGWHIEQWIFSSYEHLNVHSDGTWMFIYREGIVRCKNLIRCHKQGLQTYAQNPWTGTDAVWKQKDAVSCSFLTSPPQTIAVFHLVTAKGTAFG